MPQKLKDSYGKALDLRYLRCLSCPVLLLALLLLLQHKKTMPTTSSSDETYLEAFMETLGTLPYELRRNLDLVRTLDCHSSSLHRLRQLHQAYLLAAEEKLLQQQVVVQKNNAASGFAVMNKPLATAGVQVGVGSSSTADDAGVNGVVVLPTTAEWWDLVTDPQKLVEIEQLQEQCLQKAEEKVSVAQQAFELIDAQVVRLDEDLAAMEELLQVGCVVCACVYTSLGATADIISMSLVVVVVVVAAVFAVYG